MKARKASLKQVVNDALRVGLTAPAREARGEGPRYRTPVHQSGRCLLASLDCVSEALAAAEGEGYK
jgi:hypothetical protein